MERDRLADYDFTVVVPITIIWPVTVGSRKRRRVFTSTLSSCVPSAVGIQKNNTSVPFFPIPLFLQPSVAARIQKNPFIPKRCAPIKVPSQPPFQRPITVMP